MDRLIKKQYVHELTKNDPRYNDRIDVWNVNEEGNLGTWQGALIRDFDGSLTERGDIFSLPENLVKNWILALVS